MPDSPRAESRWTRLREFVRKTRLFWWTAGVIVLAALMIVLLWKVPQVQVEKYVNAAKTDGRPLEAKDRFNIENEARRTLATTLGAIVLLGGAYFTWRNIKVAQEGQITDRFTKAIEQLGAVDASGKKKLEVRLGGIYALERIANQSERDHWPIMEVLCTYVRENAPMPEESTQENQALAETPLLTHDIQAILTVLGRRDRKHERENEHLDLSMANLNRANLSGAILGGAHLWGARLRGADLGGADLRGADLLIADLSEASLTGANLRGADLSNTNLRQAWLRRACLSGANLIGAYLGNADLRDANLSGTDLRLTGGLTQEQIDLAKGDSNTQLPDGLHVPDRWKT